jgi:hypothetical protein
MHERSYLTSVDSGHVSDGEWGFLSVHETNQVEHGLRYYSSACSIQSVRMWICDQISEHFRQKRLGSETDGRIVLSHTFVAPAFTADKKSRCDIKFVKWLVRNSQLCTELYSCVRLHDMKTDMKCVVQSKV